MSCPFNFFLLLVSHSLSHTFDLKSTHKRSCVVELTTVSSFFPSALRVCFVLFGVLDLRVDLIEYVFHSRLLFCNY